MHNVALTTSCGEARPLTTNEQEVLTSAEGSKELVTRELLQEVADEMEVEVEHYLLQRKVLCA
jgi:hypothetical protein